MIRIDYSRAVTALVALLVAGLLMLLVVARPAHAATFTVNSTGDAPDQNTSTDNSCSTGNFVAVSPGPISQLQAECTLRAAIQQANATSGADTINFNIPTNASGYDSATGVWTIAPASALPGITDTVTIDGYSQPGASPNTLAVGNDAVLLIEISGASAGGTTGLRIVAPNSVVKGLVINRFEFVGLLVESVFGNPAATGNRIEGNFIGTDASGTQDLGNAGGVLLNASNSVVGGTTPAARNLISGNTHDGVTVNTYSGNRVEGNYIGTEKDGISALGNGEDGVWNSGSNNTVGGGDAGAANVIAFNGEDGVRIANSTGNAILNNSIFSNGLGGIDLGFDGRTANDDKDPDTGPNDLQNFPVITSAKTARKFTLIKGKLNSTPGQTFTIRFFTSPKSTKDEGKTFIGELTGVTTDATSGDGPIMVPVQKVKPGLFVTATATNDSTGDTSEFSAPKKVVRR